MDLFHDKKTWSLFGLFLGVAGLFELFGKLLIVYEQDNLIYQWPYTVLLTGLSICFISGSILIYEIYARCDRDLKPVHKSTIIHVIPMLEGLKQFVRDFIADKRGGVSAEEIVGIGIGLFLFGIFFPLAMTELMGANTTDWPTGVTTIFQTVLPILGIIAVALGYLRTKV